MGFAASCSGGGGKVALGKRLKWAKTMLPAQISSCSCFHVTEVGRCFANDTNLIKPHFGLSLGSDLSFWKAQRSHQAQASMQAC